MYAAIDCKSHVEDGKDNDDEVDDDDDDEDDDDDDADDDDDDDGDDGEDEEVHLPSSCSVDQLDEAVNNCWWVATAHLKAPMSLLQPLKLSSASWKSLLFQSLHLPQ